MVFYWSLSDSKSPQVSRNLLSILADLNDAIIWMVSTRLRPFINPLVAVPRAPNTISIIVTFMFHNFFNSHARSMYFSLFSLSFNFTLLSAETVKSTILQVLSFYWLLQGLVVWPRLNDPFVCQNPRRICSSFSRTDVGSGIYHLFVWSNFNFLHNSQWITLPTQSCLVL